MLKKNIILKNTSSVFWFLFKKFGRDTDDVCLTDDRYDRDLCKDANHRHRRDIYVQIESKL